LLDRIEQLRLSENTLIVLWGDHGWKLGEHNSWAKMTNYEIDTRAPIIMRAPGKIPENLQLDQLVEFVDIYPTLTDLAGLPVPDHLQGISAVPLFERPHRPWKSAVFSQFLREGIWQAPDGISYMGYGMRTERYNYVAWMNWQTTEYIAYELYDHRTDPGENVNLAGKPEYAAIIADLEARREAGWRGALPSGAVGAIRKN
jgi:arylsulfatase A-like enzyme